MKLSSWSIGLLLVVAGSLCAGPVTVNNPSFENPPLGCSASNECFSASVTDWVITGTVAVFKPGPASLNSVPGGVQVLALGFDTPGEADQDTGTVVAANTTYTLSVNVGQRLEFGMATSYSIGLFGLKTNTNDVAPTPGNFLLDTLVYTSTPGDVGKEIIIQLISTSPIDTEKQADFDLVTLDATSLASGSAPEPSAFVLAGLGLLPLALLRRRR
jgi:hypothetical protein